MCRDVSFTLIIIAIEITVFGFLYLKEASQPTPPKPNLAVVDSFTADDLTYFRDTTKAPADWHRL